MNLESAFFLDISLDLFKVVVQDFTSLVFKIPCVLEILQANLFLFLIALD